MSMTLTRTRNRAPALVYGAVPQVNLLPPAERARREQALLARRWTVVVVAAVAVVLVAVLAAVLLERSAQSDLDAERSRTTALAGQVAAYQDVATATGEKATYEAKRAEGMKDDVNWVRVVGALQAVLPRGARIGGFDAVVGDASSIAAARAGTDGAAGLAPAVPAAARVGVTVKVTSMQPLDQRAIIGSFTHVPGVLGADMSNLASSSSASYVSTTSVYFDDSVLSHAYDGTSR
ncbi:hypothetical protein [Nocardioides nematodiphilus]|uniref:hypothetical protein n=1 Tax=Nocardioides nematodiphilus TaxID=2849669 RepID=UPI001CD9B575|nr:hypothetical protein [Nocardioides nematodiphilus]MCA1981267.1 hypothetical protein [Nocardioides nematodiphilus]